MRKEVLILKEAAETLIEHAKAIWGHTGYNPYEDKPWIKYHEVSNQYILKLEEALKQLGNIIDEN